MTDLISAAFSYFIAKGDHKEPLFHYTTIEALFAGILSNKRNPGEEICLWASNCEYMNDPDEIKTGIKFAEEFLTLLLGDDVLFSEESKTNMLKKTFILSFSACADELPMWNTYGNGGKGINLEIDLTDYLNQNIHHYLAGTLYSYPDAAKRLSEKVRELSEKAQFKELIKKIQLDVDIELLAWILVMITKNEYYDYENEIRLAYMFPEQVEYRQNKGLIIPYTKVFLPKEKLKSITIGPCADFSLTEKSLRTYLDSIGFEHVVIKQSSINFRN